MKPQILLFATALVTAIPAAHAADDEMMGTMINGRIERRAERTARVPDPEMDREEMIIDRERRQHRDAASPHEEAPVHAPYQGKLPD